MTQPLFAGPDHGSPITMGKDGKLNVPDQPIIPFIEGDGTGPDIWRASSGGCSMRAVQKAYGGKRRVRLDGRYYAGEKAFQTVHRQLAARRNCRRHFSTLLVRHQGAAHDAGGWWDYVRST